MSNLTKKVLMVTTQRLVLLLPKTTKSDNAESEINDSQITNGNKTENVTIDTANCDNAKSGINDSQSTDSDKNRECYYRNSQFR